MASRQTPHLGLRGKKQVLLRSFLLLALCMACQTPPEGPQPDPLDTPIPTLESGKVTPLPGFEEILIYGGGGERPVLCYTYPSEPGSVLVEGPVGDHAVLCIHQGGVQTAAPIKVTLEQAGSTGIALESSDLILDRGRHRVYWTGFIGGDEIAAWTREGSVYFALSIWWPATLPPGLWTVTVSQQGGTSAAGEVQVSNAQEFTYIQALDEHSEQKLMPALSSNGSQSLRLPESGGLKVSGGGYPPETPVYIALYEQQEPGYVLIQTTTAMSDHAGAVQSEIGGPLEAGTHYILFGVTDPASLLSDAGYFECQGYLSDRQNSACDDFHLIPAVTATTPYSTQVPLSCPGAPNSYLFRGHSAYVCTQSADVSLQAEPSGSAETLRSLEPGTRLYLYYGEPACADDATWWQVTLDDGTSGWVAEGGDELDPYFICPMP